VELAGRVGQRGAAGYVNGLLRHVARLLVREGDAGLRALFPDAVAEPVAHLAAWHSVPPWLAAKWYADHGPERAAELCAASAEPAPLWLHVLAPYEPAVLAAALAADGCPVTGEASAPRALRPADAPSRAELVRLLDGLPGLIVQDLHVQAACDFLLAGCESPALDLCAAPGGKTFRLRAALDAASLLVAADLSAQRLGLLRDTMRRTGRTADLVVAADGLQAPFVDDAFATVLLDGPCSGTGVLRRHPEGRWRLRPETITESARRLSALAREAARLVRPGGRLLYATCSVEPEENEGVLEVLLAADPGLVYDAPAQADAVRRWLPRRDGGDGFFAARLRRRGGTG
jgi:16S rRNA (cytosine967-C5)-methyltransferase